MDNTLTQYKAHTAPARADAETLLFDLVNTPSPSGEESDAVRVLVRWMQAHGFRAHVDAAGNAIGEIGTGARTLVLLGHIDTFGGFPPVHITHTDSGRALYGRGSVDAKGALCTFAVAAGRARIPDGWRVIVVGAVEEEAPTSKGARYAATQYQPDACIIGEPSAWDRVTLGYKGRLLVDWSWRGGMAHSAHATATAPERAVAYWERVRAWVDALNGDESRIFHRLDATLQAIHSQQDGAYTTAQLTVGLRLPPHVDPRILADALSMLADDDAHTVAYGHEHAITADRDTRISRALRGAIRTHGGTPRFVHKTGTSDMNIVAPLWNCPIAAYGPGDSALDHTPDEHLLLDEFHRACDVLTTALEGL